MGLTPGRGAKIPHDSQTKNQNRNNIVTNSIKTLKMAHIKKKRLSEMKPRVFRKLMAATEDPTRT